jgi:hypothetical protein
MDLAVRGDSTDFIASTGLSFIPGDAAHAAQQIQSKKALNQYWDAFRQFDSNGDGQISFEELKAVLKRARPPHLSHFQLSTYRRGYFGC